MLPRILLTLALLPAIATHAQAPIERRTPPPPLALWPTPSTLPDAPRLHLETFDHIPHTDCRVEDLAASYLTCAGPHNGPPIFYPRDVIASIATTSHSSIPDALPKASAQSGLAVIGVGLVCGVDGGPVCKTPAIIGLSIIATGAVLAIVQHHQRSHATRLIYLAPYPPPWPIR